MIAVVFPGPMHSALENLNISVPVLAAPMAGGPSTPALVAAAAQAGSLGFLAAGYKTPQLLADQIRDVRTTTSAFGVNLFAPNPVPVDPGEFRQYAQAMQPVADRYGLHVEAAAPVEDDDAWDDKISLLLADPVPVVSFTFGVPDRDTITALGRAGSVVVQTVTSADEARLADEAGVDALAVQASVAGGHWGTLTPGKPPEQLPLTSLVRAVRATTRLPIIAAGGVSTADEISEVLRVGADAVAVGTVLLRTDESGASEVHKKALADHARGAPVLTRAFTGRPARGLPNEFIARYAARAPLGYPAIHHLTSALRRAAALAGDPEHVSLWAGTGYRAATAESATAILRRLAERLS